MTEQSLLRLATVPGVGLDGVAEVQSSTVVLIGCGGLGHPAAQYLAAAGVGRIILIDPDMVEESNLGRQVLFSGSDLGRRKAEVLGERLLAVYPRLEIKAIVGRIGDESVNVSLSDILSDRSVVLDCTDNFAARHAVSSFCRSWGHWHVWGNVFRWEGSVAVFDPSVGLSYEDFFVDPPWELRATCASGGVVGPVCGVIGSFMATQAILLITSGRSEFGGKLLEIDTAEGITAWRGPTEHSRFEDLAIDARSLEGEVISTQDAARLAHSESVVLIDVREEWERKAIPLDQAISVSMPNLWEWLRSHDPNEPLLFVCASGFRAKQASAIAQRLGWDRRIAYAVGGTAAEMAEALR